MFRIHYHHVRRQAVGEGADLARGTAGRGLSGQRKRAVTRLRLLAQQQVVGIALFVDPGTALMLVEAHGPERHHLALIFDIKIGKLLQFFLE